MKLTKLIKSVIILNLSLLVCVSSMAQASDQIPYYGDDFYKDVQGGLSGLDLQLELRNILRSFHIAREGQNDLLSKTCNNSQGHCYTHNVVGYKAARNFVTRGFYMRQIADGSFVVDDVYCDVARPSSKNGGNSPVNVEHTWPQSHFTRAYPEEMQKSDLHHLFPTDSYVNMIRGNHQFGEVDSDLQHLDCKGPRFGVGSAGPEEVFEPPQDHKGNVARALFYFATRYELTIGKDEEAVLRKWNQEDPVDQQELDRNEEIYKLQNNRNPFVDFPGLVDRIENF